MEAKAPEYKEDIVKVRNQKKKEVLDKIAKKEVENMALSKQEELDFTYTTFDKIFRLSLGETPIYSGAYYHADFSISLEQAQKQKCEFVVDSLKITKDSKVLDIGCGWGGWLNYLKQNVGCKGIGVNLSSGQTAACRKNGLEVHLMDGRAVKPEHFGQFDAITAMGSPEHFCTVSAYKEGRQDQVYKEFFEGISKILKPGGRVYLQSMTFGQNMLPLEEFDINAPKESPQYILALLRKQFPDSWLPYGGEHLIRCGEPIFKLISHSSGRVDYVETNRQWTKRYNAFNFKKYLLFASLIPKYIMDKEFRWNLRILRECANRKAFEREIFDHSRIVLEKVGE